MKEYCSRYILARMKMRTKEMPNGCLEWQGVRTNAGYGMISITLEQMSNKRQITTAHRAHYMAHHGIILQRDQVVCHTCDNPRCVKIDHLFLGTHKDNAQDCISKGRKAKKHKHHSRVRIYSDETIIAMSQEKGTLKRVAMKYGASLGYISRLRNKKAKRLIIDAASHAPSRWPADTRRVLQRITTAPATPLPIPASTGA